MATECSFTPISPPNIQNGLDRMHANVFSAWGISMFVQHTMLLDACIRAGMNVMFCASFGSRSEFLARIITPCADAFGVDTMVSHICNLSSRTGGYLSILPGILNTYFFRK